jgi:hypothetical protein
VDHEGAGCQRVRRRGAARRAAPDLVPRDHRGQLLGRPRGDAPQALEAGDILVVPHGDPYFLAAKPGTHGELDNEEAVWFFRKMAAGELPPIVTEGGGGPEKTNFICGFLGCDARPFNPILAALPRVIHLRRATRSGDRMSPPGRPKGEFPLGGTARSAKGASIHHLIEFALGELRARRAGSREVLLRLSELMFIEVVRCHLETRVDAQPDWLAGLRDPLVARVLSRLHGQPARAWTLDALAAETGTSRSGWPSASHCSSAGRRCTT